VKQKTVPAFHGSSPGLDGWTALPLVIPASVVGLLLAVCVCFLTGSFVGVLCPDVSILMVPSVAETLLEAVFVLMVGVDFWKTRPSLVKLIIHIVNTANRKTVPKE
jgi:hypothetical protein